MTNLFAVKIVYKRVPYIFCVSDSQASSRTDGTKDPYVIKLLQRDHNLVMATGRGDIAQTVYDRIKGKKLEASDLAQEVLKVSEDIARTNVGDKSAITSVFVAGKDKKGVEMYEVELIDIPSDFTMPGIRRGVLPVSGMYLAGSGRRHVVPAILRDQELGYATHPTNPLEALLLCFYVGTKADMDLGVNQKLQLGLVSPSTVRLLLPPGVFPRNYEDFNAYNASITGIPFNLSAKSKDKDIEERLQVSPVINAFYHALETQMVNLMGRDVSANRSHTMRKAGKCTRKKYEEALRNLRSAKERSKVLVDAFMEGGIGKLASAIRQFNKWEEEYLKASEKLAPKP